MCDIDAEVAMARARAWGAAPERAYGDWHELLADPSLDAFEILPPHHMHLEVGLAAVATGRHVSMQKPVAFTVADADRFAVAADAASARGQVVRIFENFLFYPPVAQAPRRGAWRRDRGRALGAPEEPLRRSSLGLERAAAASAWRFDLDRCGGGPLVFDDGLHKFSIFWSLLGIAAEVHAWIGSTPVEGGALDAPSLVGCAGNRSRRQPGGRNAPQLRIATRHYVQDDRVEVNGTKGVAWVNRGHGRLLEEPALRVYRDGRATDHVDLETGWGGQLHPGDARLHRRRPRRPRHAAVRARAP